MTNLKNYLEVKVNNRGNKNLNYLSSFFSDTELSILSDKTISIVGTNGKSSTANNISMLLKGLDKSYISFTSPHLVDYKERITCLLYTSPSPRDRTTSRMPSAA